MPGRHTIVYIEDNRANLALVTKVLEHTGEYKIVGAVSGEKGIEVVRETVPRLVLLDLDLPQMDGFDVAHQLRQDPALAQIPIVAISASVLKQERDEAMASGFSFFLEKPFDIKVLRRVVEDAIEGRLNPVPDTA